MGKSKNPATGEGFLGEIMVHKLTRAVGVVDSVTEASAGWPPQIVLKLARNHRDAIGTRAHGFDQLALSRPLSKPTERRNSSRGITCPPPPSNSRNDSNSR